MNFEYNLSRVLAHSMVYESRQQVRENEDPQAIIATATILAVAAVAAVAAAGVGAYSSYSAAAAQKQSAEYNTEVAGYNQKVAANSALAAEQQGALDAYRIRQQNLRTLGTVQANEGKSGGAGGSANDIAYDDSVQGEMNALVTGYKSATQAAQYTSQGQVAQQQGVLAGMQASSINPGISAGGSALSGLATGAGAMAPYFRQGGTSSQSIARQDDIDNG